MRRPTALVIILAALLAGGCRSMREATTATTEEPSQTEQAKKKACFTANFTTTVSDMNVTGQIRMSEDSIVWLSASKIIELGRMVLTKDTIAIYAKINNRYYKDTYQGLRRETGHRTDFETVNRQLMDAYRRKAETVSFDIDAEQYKGRVTLHIKGYKPAESLTYPFTIPSNARPL